MRDDEKIFNIGVIMVLFVVIMIAFLQVCYRVQNTNLRVVRNSMEETKRAYNIAATQFSSLKSANSLRNSLDIVNNKAEIVSFSKTVHINDIPMVGE